MRIKHKSSVQQVYDHSSSTPDFMLKCSIIRYERWGDHDGGHYNGGERAGGRGEGEDGVGLLAL